MLGILKSGEQVFDRPRSHLHAGAAALLPEALAAIDSEGREFFRIEHHFGRVVGETTCVRTNPGEHIIFARRENRLGLTRFVKNRKPEPCNKVVVILKKDDFEDYYVLITAFIGHRPEPEPWDRNANGNSLAFWNSHALVWGSDQIIPSTETTECPW